MTKEKKAVNGVLNAGIFIGKKDLRFNAFSFVAAAVCKDETRYHMRGVHITRTGGRLSFVCTDGYRLHWAEDAEGGVEAWLNAAGIDTERLTGHTFSVMKSAAGIVIGQEVEGVFPGWEKLVDKDWKAADGVEFTKEKDYTDGIYQVYRTGYQVRFNHLADIYRHGSGWWMGKQEKGAPAVRFSRADISGAIFTALCMPMEYADPMKGLIESAKAEAVSAERKRRAKADEAKARKEKAVVPYEAPRIEYKPEAPAVEALDSTPETEAADDFELTDKETKRKASKGKNTRAKEERQALNKERAAEAKAQYERILNSAGNDEAKLYALLNALNARSPCAKYSFRNKVIVVANGTLDARSFLEWKKAGRKVKKGAKAFYISMPCLFKETAETDEEGKPITEAVGYGLTAVFRYEDTEQVIGSVAYVYEPIREPAQTMSNAA
jgi:hypothetical protein